METQVQLPLMTLFVLLFSMAGPLRLVPMFSVIAGSAPPPVRNRLALKTAAWALAGLALATVAGHGVMKSWGVSPEALGAGIGLVLTLASLQPMLGTGGHGPAMNTERKLPSAVSLAFPLTVPPYAVGVIILFSAYTSHLQSQLLIIALGAGLMLINLVSMIYSTRIFKLLGEAGLRLLGAVFAILQLSLGIEMIYWSLQSKLLA